MQAVKKGAAPKKARMKQDVKSKVMAKKWLLMPIIFNDDH